MSLRRRSKPSHGNESPAANIDPGPAADGPPKRSSRPTRWIPAPPTRRGLVSSRIHVVLSAIVIGLFFAVSRRFADTKTVLPDSWALCSRAESGSAIYTVDPAHPTVECIVVHRKHILDWGTAKNVREKWGDRDVNGPVAGAPFVSAKTGLKFKYLKKGHAAYPGFSDAHAHVLDYGATRELNLVGASSIEEVRGRLRGYILSKPELLNDTSIWIQTLGWDQNRFPGGQYPTAADLEEDELLRGRPISLARVDVHAYWVSPKVIELLGALPHQIEGGLIVRDEDGKPTGIFVDNAMDLVDKAKPMWSTSQMLGYFKIAVKDALSHGLTSIHDAATYPSMIQFYKRLADQGALPIRLYLMAHVDSNDYWGDQLEKLVGYADERLNLRSVKLFTDGALGSWGAALLEPYSDQPNNSGLMRLSTATINEHVRRFVEDGWQTNVHCIGDRANHEVLDAFEIALSNSSLEGYQHRHRIEHAQILTQDDIKRLGRIGLIASVQPTHATSDMGYAETRLGPERIKGAYAWQTLKQNGAQISLGSDFPVESVNPLLGFYAAITRLDVDGNSPHGPGGWFPSQRLSREEALQGMTLNAAYAAYQEDILGSLKPGKRADIVILDTDIMRAPVADILTAKVAATIIDGVLMYGDV